LTTVIIPQQIKTSSKLLSWRECSKRG